MSPSTSTRLPPPPPPSMGEAAHIAEGRPSSMRRRRRAHSREACGAKHKEPHGQGRRVLGPEALSRRRVPCSRLDGARKNVSKAGEFAKMT
jgi:hypothetical protein